VCSASSPTRADFYVGKGANAEWLGSIAWDGYRDGIDKQILHCKSPEAFRHAVKSFFADRDDVTLPENGWPWPWESSHLTDCSYWFFDDQAWDEHDKCYVPCSRSEPEDDEGWVTFLEGCEQIDFPNMTDIQNVTFGRGSGLIVIGG